MLDPGDDVIYAKDHASRLAGWPVASGSKSDGAVGVAQRKQNHQDWTAVLAAILSRYENGLKSPISRREIPTSSYTIIESWYEVSIAHRLI